MRRIVFIALALALGAVVGGTAAWLANAPSEPPPGDTTAVEIGGPFTLTDQHGETVTDQTFAGRFMLIYFGYTFCPDFCPMSLQTMTQAIDGLSEDVAERVVPIFITVDPERDTVAQLAEYAPLFHPELVALTGSPEAIADVAGAYRVYYRRAEDSGTTADYLMDHSVFVYLIGPDGTYRAHFTHDVDPETMGAKIEEAVDRG